jgi:hypothetical protein
MQRPSAKTEAQFVMAMPPDARQVFDLPKLSLNKKGS